MRPIPHTCLAILATLAIASSALAATTSNAPRDPQSLKADMRFFTDSSCSQLAPNVQSKDLASFKSDLLKTVAAALLNNTYDETYRAARYEACLTISEAAKPLKVKNSFSRYENITGMYLEAGQHIVFVGPTGGKKISLLIPDWMRQPPAGIPSTKDPAGWGLKKQTIQLKEGLNIIQVEKSSLAYISYFDDHPDNAPKITVHFPTGKVNGYFDATKQTNADWNRLLDNAAAPILDARGRHIQLAFPVEYYNAYARGKGVELVRAYDTILHYHYTFAGFVKYNEVPKNRILARVNYNYYMFQDGDGAAFMGNKNTMSKVVDPKEVVQNWGAWHEIGHTLQMSPQLSWGGLGEVSVNFYAQYTGTQLGNPSRLKKQNNYATARKAIIETRASYLQAANLFDRLVPFWQLHLYFARHGHPDFYADVMETLRHRPSAGAKNDAILNQFEFIKIACDITQTDLTDFFEKWGFFYVGTIAMKDYGTYNYTITQQMVDETKASIAKKNYKKPATDITLMED